MKKVRILFLCVVFLICSWSGKVMSYAASCDDVRVGLTAYTGKSSVKINTKKINIGFSNKNKYTVSATLSGSSGFKVKAAKGYYSVSKDTFSSFDDVCSAVDKVCSVGVTAYAALTANNKWRIYAGGSHEKSDADAQFAKLNHSSYSFGAMTADNKHRVIIKGGKVRVIYDGERSEAYVQIDSATEYALSLNGKAYRGRLEIGRYGKDNLTVVNVVQVDDYVRGVVPAEVGSSYPIEALKAQAVVARSFAVSHSGFVADSNISTPYKLNDTTASQVYRGCNVEASTTNKAVKETIGKMIFYKGKVASTTFFSTSGGATESAENVWGGKVAYCKSVPDIYELSPAMAPWTVKYTGAQLGAKLSASGVSVGTVTDISVDKVSDSGRVIAMTIKGTSGETTISKEQVRNYLGLSSPKMKVLSAKDNTSPDQVSVINGEEEISTISLKDAYFRNGKKTEKASSSLTQYVAISAYNLTNFPKSLPADGTFLFAGMGFGHGVGMSQSGAKCLAKEGYSYQQIIHYYYQNVRIK